MPNGGYNQKCSFGNGCLVHHTPNHTKQNLIIIHSLFTFYLTSILNQAILWENLYKNNKNVSQVEEYPLALTRRQLEAILPDNDGTLWFHLFPEEIRSLREVVRVRTLKKQMNG